jgi:hypothetical protein
MPQESSEPRPSLEDEKETLEMLHDLVFFIQRGGRGSLEKQINGALTDCIKSHGPITEEWRSSASRRIVTAVKAYLKSERILYHNREKRKEHNQTHKHQKRSTHPRITQ